MTESTTLDRVERIAEEVLFPAAMAVDSGERDLSAHLDVLAAEGLYGILAPDDRTRVTEVLASGCLTTAFVWAQHHSAVRAAAESVRLRDEWFDDLRTGRRRAGVAIGAAIRPGPPALRASAVPGGYLFDGAAPWVTGWGYVDAVYTAARDPDDVIVWALLDARAGESLAVARLRLSAVDASDTVNLEFHRHFVPEDRVTGRQPHHEYQRHDAQSLRFNGSLALGLIDRCCRLVGPSPLSAQLAAARTTLDTASPADLPDARAAAAELAVRAAAAVAVTTGSRAVLADQHAQRLAREATFLLVFGSRPPIRAALLDRLVR